MPAVNFWAQIAYDGSAFLGWQQTKMGRSVQGTLQRAAEQIAGCPVIVEAASRTDRGVHARGQLIGLYPTVPLKRSDHFLQGLSRILPSDVAILSGGIAAAGWHPSLSASGKVYRYQVSLRPEPLLRGVVWELPRRGWVSQDLDRESMRACADLITGAHDFRAFATDQQRMIVNNPLCIIASIELCWESATLLSIWLRGDRFLYKMCRTIAGTIIQVGQQKIHIEGITRALATGNRSGIGMCAPAHGLCLMQVMQSEASGSQCHGWPYEEIF